MKRIFPLLTAIALMMSGCINTREAAEVANLPLVLTAYQEGSPVSKTAVEDGGTQVFWEPGDEIKVFSGSRNGKFTANVSGLTAVAEFTGHLEGFGTDVTDIWAVYPYGDEASFDGESITTVIPSVQIARPGTFAQGANVAIAHSNTTSLQFFNVGGGIRFSLTEEGIRKIIFEGLNGETISGTIRVAFEDGQPKVKEVTGGSMFITLLPPEGDCFSVNTWYYITAVPGALDAGFKLRFYKDDDTYAKLMYEKAVSIKRRVFLSLANADVDCVFEAVTTNFPETEEEWKESVEMTEESSEAIGELIESYWESSCSIESLIEDVKNVENVVEVIMNEDESVVMVMQKDSIWVNYMLEDVDNSYDFAPLTSSSEQSFSLALGDKKSVMKSSSFLRTPEDSFISNNKKALILSPFYSESESKGATYLQYWEQGIKSLFEKVDVLKNEEAGIECFREDFLSQYDFILIDTHGVLGCFSTGPKDWVLTGAVGAVHGLTMSLVSSTPYSLIAANLLYFKYNFKPEELSYTWHKYKTYMCMTPSFLQRKSLKNCAVVLSACQTAYNIDNCSEDDVNGSISGAFLNNGARLVAGTIPVMRHGANEVFSEKLLQLMSYGLSFQDAYDYIANSPKTQTIVDQFSDFYPDTELEGWDIPHSWIYRSSRNTYNEAFYWYNPYPSQLVFDEKECRLKWECRLKPFTIDWEDKLCGDRDNAYWKYVRYDYSVQYEVHISDCLPCSTDLKSVEFTPQKCGEYTWYVIAKIMEGDTVVASYRSDNSKFIVEGLTPPPPEYPTPDAVDLGLPSGLKWASFNLGASRPEEYGGYFAWGETEPKSEYTWNNYKWSNGDYNKLTKYCTDSSYWDSSDPMDNQTILDPDDDAASANLGDSWRIPTDEEWMELRNNCTGTWTSNYNGTGIDGLLLTSKMSGYETKSIFLPSAGYRDGAHLKNDASSGLFWSSSLSTGYEEEHARDFWFEPDYVSKNGIGLRYLGLSVRPVFWAPKVTVTGVWLNQGKTTISVGESYQLVASVEPANASNNSVIWTSSDESIAVVSSSGLVRGLREGSATITVSTVEKGFTASCEVTVMESTIPPNGHEYVDLGLPSGLKWATCNVGADNPEEYGDYFAWGEKVPKNNYNWTTYKWCNGNYHKLTKYCTDISFWDSSAPIDNKTVLDLEDDAANANWGGSWRMPTDAEWTELKENCTWTWMALNGVNGYKVTSNKTSYTDKSIFLPAAGNWQNAQLYNAVSCGFYWSSVLSTDGPYSAWTVKHYNGNVGWSSIGMHRCCGQSIRPVTK